MDHEYVLVIQFPANDNADFDALIAIEDDFVSTLEPQHSVDGHDFGSGEMNIFIFSNSPEEVFTGHVRGILESHEKLDVAMVAWRPVEGEHYSVLWPQPFRGEFSVA